MGNLKSKLKKGPEKDHDGSKAVLHTSIDESKRTEKYFGLQTTSRNRHNSSDECIPNLPSGHFSRANPGQNWRTSRKVGHCQTNCKDESRSIDWQERDERTDGNESNRGDGNDESDTHLHRINASGTSTSALSSSLRENFLRSAAVDALRESLVTATQQLGRMKTQLEHFKTQLEHVRTQSEGHHGQKQFEQWLIEEEKGLVQMIYHQENIIHSIHAKIGRPDQVIYSPECQIVVLGRENYFSKLTLTFLASKAGLCFLLQNHENDSLVIKSVESHDDLLLAKRALRYLQSFNNTINIRKID